MYSSVIPQDCQCRLLGISICAYSTEHSLELWDYNIASWRKQIAYDNIAFGLEKVDMSEDKLDLCLKTTSEAHCDFFDNLIEGIQTSVGSPGFARLLGECKDLLTCTLS
jgi:hypothetical protein